MKRSKNLNIFVLFWFQVGVKKKRKKRRLKRLTSLASDQIAHVFRLKIEFMFVSKTVNINFNIHHESLFIHFINLSSTWCQYNQL